MCAIWRRCVVVFCGVVASSVTVGQDGGAALVADDRGAGGVAVRWEDRITLTPPAPDRSFGRDVGAAGDVNGDGVHDVAVTAPGYGEGTSRVGRVFLFSGADGAPLREMRGQTGERFGVRLESAEDVDGDGVWDLGVAAVAHDAERRFVERRHVLSGRTGERLYVKDVLVWDPRAEGLLEEDLSRDGVVDAADVALAVEGLARGGMRVDLDGDGVWTSVDVGRVLEAVGRVGGEPAERGGDINWEEDPRFFCWREKNAHGCMWGQPPDSSQSGFGIPGDEEFGPRACFCAIGGQRWATRGESGTLYGGATLIQGGVFEWEVTDGLEFLTNATPDVTLFQFTAGLDLGEIDFRLTFHSPGCMSSPMATHTLAIDDLFLELQGCPDAVAFDEWVRVVTPVHPQGGELTWEQVSGPPLTHWDPDDERLEVVTGFEAGVVRLTARYLWNGLERTRVCEFEVFGRPDRDHDDDGLSDADEVTAGTDPTNPDTDGDGLGDLCEWEWGTDGADGASPDFNAAPWNEDADRDGLPDMREACLGLDPAHLDTDRDGLLDSFEVEHGLDPLSPDSDGDGTLDWSEDDDGDGLINGREQAHQSDPFNADSDGDGANDAVEVAQGSFPLSAADGGETPPDDEAVQITLTVGDPSSSNSESWGLMVGELPHVAPLGEVITETFAFERGRVHEVTVVHMGTSVSPPDYDYEAGISWTADWIALDDPDNLLGYFLVSCDGGAGGDGAAEDAIGGDPRNSCNRTEGRVATLKVLRLDLDVDSDNTDGYNPPAGDEDEEEIEDETEQELSKLVVMNIGDRDGDGVPGFADGMDMDPVLEEDNESALDRFVPVRLTLSAGFDFEEDRIVFGYSGSDPAGITVTPREGGGAHYVAAPGALRLWLKDGVVTRNAASVADEGDFVAPDVQYTAAELGLDGDEGGVIQLWVEAIEPSVTLGDHRIEVTMGGVTDAVRLTAYGTRVVNLGPDGSLLDTHEPVLSHPTPVIQASQLELINVRPNEDRSRLIADLVVSGTVDDALSDLIPGADGVISHLDVLINGRGDPDDGESPAARIDVQFSKGGTFGQILRPHDYTGVFNAVATVDVSPGVNTVELVAQNSRGYMGFAERSFTVEVEAPPDVEVAVVTQYVKGQDDLSVWIVMTAGGAPQVFAAQLQANGQGDYESPAHPGTWVYIGSDPIDGEPYVMFSHPPFGLSHCDVGGESTFDGATGVVTFVGEREYLAAERVDWTGWETQITSPTEISASNGGEFRPFLIETLGPDALMNMAEDISIRSEFENVFGQSVSRDRTYGVGLHGNNRTFLSPVGSGQPSVMLAMKPVQLEDTAPEQEGERRDGVISFVEGFGRGIADTGVEIWDTGGSVASGAWHAVSNYNTISVIWRIANGGPLLVEEDQQRLSVTIDVLEGLAQIAYQLRQAGTQYAYQVMLGEEDLLEDLGEVQRLAFMYGVELVQAALEAAANMDDYEKGRIAGRIISELAFEVALGAATGGTVAVAHKSVAVARAAARFANVPNVPAPVKNAVSSKADGLQALNPGMCFVAGTLVHTATGLRPIESIRTGDLALSRDPESGEMGRRRVLRTFVTHPEELITIQFRSDSGFDVENSLTGTGEHPFYVIDQERFVPMGKLVLGDRLLLSDGVSTAYVTDIQVQRGPPDGSDTFTTYNFEVEGWHTYFVGKLGASEAGGDELGAWVHNHGGPCSAAASIDLRLRELENVHGLPKLTRFLQETQPEVTDTSTDFSLPAILTSTQREIYRQAATLDDAPTARQLYDYRDDQTRGARLRAANVQVHHTVPKYLLKRAIQIAHPEWTDTQVDAFVAQIADDMPGMLLHTLDHNGSSSTPLSAFHQRLADVIRPGTQGDIATVQQIKDALRDAYVAWGHEDVWVQAERWLDIVLSQP